MRSPDPSQLADSFDCAITLFSKQSSIELNTWKDSLSPEVDLTASSRPVALPHRMTLHLTYWWLLILLHRPFYRRHRGGAADIDHVKVCLYCFLRFVSLRFSSHADLGPLFFSPFPLLAFPAASLFSPLILGLLYGFDVLCACCLSNNLISNRAYERTNKQTNVVVKP